MSDIFNLVLIVGEIYLVLWTMITIFKTDGLLKYKEYEEDEEEF